MDKADSDSFFSRWLVCRSSDRSYTPPSVDQNSTKKCGRIQFGPSIQVLFCWKLSKICFSVMRFIAVLWFSRFRNQELRIFICWTKVANCLTRPAESQKSTRLDQSGQMIFLPHLAEFQILTGRTKVANWFFATCLPEFNDIHWLLAAQKKNKKNSLLAHMLWKLLNVWETVYFITMA